MKMNEIENMKEIEHESRAKKDSKETDVARRRIMGNVREQKGYGGEILIPNSIEWSEGFGRRGRGMGTM